MLRTVNGIALAEVELSSVTLKNHCSIGICGRSRCAAFCRTDCPHAGTIELGQHTLDSTALATMQLSKIESRTDRPIAPQSIEKVPTCYSRPCLAN